MNRFKKKVYFSSINNAKTFEEKKRCNTAKAKEIQHNIPILD